MYGLSYTTCRLARKLPTVQISYFSKFTTYREITNGTTKVATTTLVQGTIDRERPHRRYLSLGNNLSNIAAKQLNEQFKVIVSQSKEILRTVKLSDLQAAPMPAFWYGFAGLIPFAAPELLFILFGYSEFLATAQLLYGATICSFVGGMKWGHATAGSSQEPSWENLGYAVVPQLIAWTGLLLPQTLGFLMVIGGLASAMFIDLIGPYYAPWAKALRLCLTVPAIFFLFLTCLMGIFH